MKQTSTAPLLPRLLLALLFAFSAGCLQPPAAPRSLAAVGSSGKISLTWEGAAESTFLVLRAERSGGPYQQVYSGLAAFYSDPLPPLSTRFYVVRAEGRGGSSGFSREASATTAPAAPSNLRVTPQGGGALLEWDPVEGATSYTVQRAAGSGNFGLVAGSLAGTNFTDPIPADGLEYAWRVQAAGFGGLGEPSQTVRAKAAPGAPAGLGVVSGGGVVILHWRPVPAATGYRISRAPAGGQFALLGSTAGTSFADPAPGAGPLRYQVEPFGPGGVGAASVIPWTGDGDSLWVVAHGVTTFVYDGGEAARPMDFNIDQWSILQQDASGNWQRSPGYPTNMGYLLFLGVQPGAYLLERVRTGYPMPYLTATDARDLDLSETGTGRPEQGLVTKDGTGVQLSVSGLTPWHADVAQSGSGDSLELFSLGGNLDLSNDQNLTEGATSGSTSMTAIPWFNGFANSTAGDVSWLTQSSLRATPEGGYFGAVSASWSGSLTMAPSVLAPLQASLQPAPQRSATLTLQGSQFAALSAEMASPDQPMFWDSIQQYALPGVQAHGFYALGPTLFSLDDVRWIHGFQDADRTIPLTWGDPFPADWIRFGYLNVYYRKTVKAPGATTGRVVFSDVFVMDEWSSFSTTPLAPRLSGVLHATAGGMPLGDTLVVGAGLSPVIAWQPPRLGTADTYSVHLNALGVSASGGTTATPRLFLRTRATQVRIPTGYLQAGVAYVVYIRAENPGLWAGRMPNTPEPRALHWASSVVAAGAFQP